MQGMRRFVIGLALLLPASCAHLQTPYVDVHQYPQPNVDINKYVMERARQPGLIGRFCVPVDVPRMTLMIVRRASAASTHADCASTPTKQTVCDTFISNL